MMAEMAASNPPRYDWAIKGPSPPFPYIPGFSVKIRRFTSRIKSKTEIQTTIETSLESKYPPGFHEVSAIEYCIGQPPLQLDKEQDYDTSHQAEEHILHMESITTRPATDIFWNEVQCFLDDDKESRYTAKIYDPVYSSDVAFARMCANRSFNNEAKSYTRLEEAGISGRVTPVFSGAWRMDVPVPCKEFGGVDYATTRPVGLLLFKEVQAVNLASTYLMWYYTSDCIRHQPQLPRAWRLEVLAKIYEAVNLIVHAGVIPEVYMDRVLVMTSGLDDGKLDVRVWIANLERSRILDLEQRAGEARTRPVSPIETYWSTCMYDAQWLVPSEWQGAESMGDYRQWLVQRWGESTEYRQLPAKLQKRIADGEWDKDDENDDQSEQEIETDVGVQETVTS
ncbi:hypothetical protein Daus18300_007753 [Diaporthe australafricana]|uniref:Uncharacterized protein n=1 Tax=Diaporthe australafricana TaxID=127596 RepID=A0ABR3WLQ3_9PEZI